MRTRQNSSGWWTPTSWSSPACCSSMGALGDRFGRARALQIGLAIFGLASLSAPLATDVTHLIAVRVAMGVGGALIMPSTLSVIANVFPPS